MKKYVKPELFYERYELSQHIADCAWELNSSNKADCQTYRWDTTKSDGVDFGTLFNTNLNCYNNIDAGFQNYCETNGANGINTFIS